MNSIKMNNMSRVNILDLSKVHPKKIFTKSGNKIYTLYINYQGEKVLIGDGRDRHFGRLHKEFLIVPKNKICLWYKWPAGRNQHHNENSGYRFKYSLLPRYIKLDKLTLNALGLLQAEMNKHTKRASNTVFTNSEFKLINIVLTFFNRLFIKTDEWSWRIIFNFKLKNAENKIKTKNREINSINFWISKSKLSSSKRQNKYLQYTGNKKYKTMRPQSPPYGSLQVSYSDIIYYQFILKILQDIKELIKEDKDLVKYYLQGIYAGEGHVKPSKNRSLDSLRIGCCNKSERLFYHHLLNKLDINSSVEKTMVSTSGMENFLKIYKLRLVTLHPMKNYIFLSSMLGFNRISPYLKEEYSKERENIKRGLKLLKRKVNNIYENDSMV